MEYRHDRTTLDQSNQLPLHTFPLLPPNGKARLPLLPAPQKKHRKRRKIWWITHGLPPHAVLHSLLSTKPPRDRHHRRRNRRHHGVHRHRDTRHRVTHDRNTHHRPTSAATATASTPRRYNRDIRHDRIVPLVRWCNTHFPEISTEDITPWSGVPHPTHPTLLPPPQPPPPTPTATTSTPGTSPLAGLRPMMPTMLPRVGAGKAPGVFYNTGHGHLGWTLSAATAEMVGEAVRAGMRKSKLDNSPAVAMTNQ